ncbi:DUF1080 domain-containing protein [Bacteroidales bacterium]|nr:DUF1080 domain-containing protein [Bacteroidales bacterium]
MKIKFTITMLLFVSLVLSVQARTEKGFVDLFNGANFDGWYLKLRNDNDSLAKKVFVAEDGMVHVFNDEFPAEYNLTKKNNYPTHGLFYTNDTYSKFILTFEYKWGSNVANNFHQWQYDAGCYYHVVDDKIWPVGIEYQVRYNHIKNENHSGDFWTRPLTWTATPDSSRYLSPEKGGKAIEKRGELLAATPKKHHALNGKWNKCTVIVMGNEYSIHKLNGEVINMATNLPFSEGKIGFQSETAEIFYRNIKIKEFEKTVPIEEFIK